MIMNDVLSLRFIHKMLKSDISSGYPPVDAEPETHSFFVHDI